MRGIDNLTTRAYKLHTEFNGNSSPYSDMLTAFKATFDTLSDWDKMNSIVSVRGNIFRLAGGSAYFSAPIRSSHTSFYYYGMDFNNLNFSRFEITSSGTVNYADQTNTVISGTWTADFYVM